MCLQGRFDGSCDRLIAILCILLENLCQVCDSLQAEDEDGKASGCFEAVLREMSCHASLPHVGSASLIESYRGQLHLGFLTAAIYESLVEVRTFDETLPELCLALLRGGGLSRLAAALRREVARQRGLLLEVLPGG